MLNGGTVTLKGALRPLGVPTPIETTGRLQIANRTELIYRANEVLMAIDPIPGIGPEYVEKRLNPLLDVAHLELPLRLDSIEVQPGRLIVRGTAYLPPRPKKP